MVSLTGFGHIASCLSDESVISHCQKRRKLKLEKLNYKEKEGPQTEKSAAPCYGLEVSELVRGGPGTKRRKGIPSGAFYCDVQR